MSTPDALNRPAVMTSTSATEEQPHRVSITPLLKKLAALTPLDNSVNADDIALAWSRIFENRISNTQMSALLTLLHSTGADKRPDVIAKCAAVMRDAGAACDEALMRSVLGKRKRVRGNYRGGLCDIVGTGGDAHSTFNISTTASIIASPVLTMAKHGNRAQTSMSGSADVLKAISPKGPALEAVTAEKLPKVFEKCNYAFLLAPNFHPGMKYAATVRRELGLRTIFNLMGPLANPLDHFLEARVIGVAYQQLGPIFAQSLQLSGVTKAMVVCGAEDLDEISSAGRTNCWWLKEIANPRHSKEDYQHGVKDEQPQYISQLESFSLEPSDFGLPSHPLSEVGSGKLPKENAKVLMSMLRNELDRNHPIVDFVLLNVAALLVVSGVCDAESSDDHQVITERGPGGGRWKEGVRLARQSIESGEALKELEEFIELSYTL